MYQDHLGVGSTHAGGPVFGHFVSADLVHWSRMPVAVWNRLDVPTNSTTLYDSKAIYSGSCVNSVNGSGMRIIYPGVCDQSDGPRACRTGTTVNIATPDNVTDPLATVWRKAAFNPVIHVNGSAGPGGGGPPGSGGDPSSAWVTASGETRIATRDAKVSTIWATMDPSWREWYYVGPQPGFPQGACPSFYPLPPLAPGAASPPPPGVATPTHVYMFSDTLLNPHVTAYVLGTSVTVIPCS
jgi:hypothetical protein